MREVRFRAWLPNTKEMFYGFDMDSGHGDGYLTSDPEYVRETVTIDSFKHPNITWLQYTGKKDKNGKGIYEGDVLESNGYRSEAVWSSDEGMFYISKSGTSIDRLGESLSYGDWVVVGNIYENPELLNVK